MAPDYTPELKKLMYERGITSFSSLAKTTGISRQKLQQLRQGNLQKFRLEELQQLSQTLSISLPKLLVTFAAINLDDQEPEQGYSSGRLTPTLLLQEFQQTSLQTLETWLLQWEKLAHHVRHHPEFPAIKLLPFIRPVEQLIQSWGVEAIAPIGAEIPYNPQGHRLQAGIASPGDLVKVVSPGYIKEGKLLHRSEVVAIAPVPVS